MGRVVTIDWEAWAHRDAKQLAVCGARAFRVRPFEGSERGHVQAAASSAATETTLPGMEAWLRRKRSG
jgi:hypothetical protein